MIVVGIFGGIAVVAIGVAVADLFGKGKPRRHVDARAVEISESGSSGVPVGEWFGPPDDGRPQK